MKKYMVYFFCLSMLLTLMTGCTKTSGGTSTQSKQPATSTNAAEEKQEVSDVVSSSDAQDYAESILKDMSLDEKIGQMIMVNLNALNQTPIKKSSKKKKKKKKKTSSAITKINKSIKEELQKYPIGGIVLNLENMKDKESTNKLVEDLQSATNYYPLYIATTEEWGDKSVFSLNKNLGGTAYPMLSEVATTKSLDEIYQMGKTTGQELKALGINMNLAPVADVSDGVENAQYAKYCYSDNEDEVSDYIENAVMGMRFGGVLTTLTHFPGVGAVPGDYKAAGADNDAGLTHLRDVDFAPFEAGIEAGTDAVMVSHVSVSKVTQSDTPASMSELAVTGILRDELDFEGLIITDSMSSPVITEKFEPEQSALQAIQAGVDIVMEPASLDRAFSSIREAVANRSLDEKVLNEAVMRILKNKIQRGIIQIDSTISE